MEVVHGPAQDAAASPTLVHANEDAVFRDSKVGAPTTSCSGSPPSLALARRSCCDVPAPACGAVRFLRARRCSDSSFATYLAGAPALRAQRQRRPRTSGFLVVGGAGSSRARAGCWAGALRTARSRSRSRPPWCCTCSTSRRRPPRAQHRVRLLGHGRHPRVGAGQHHVLAAHRGGAAARRAGGVAPARAADGLRGDRHARDDAAGHGRASVGGDFGAAIAGAPGFGLFAWLLLGRSIRLRTVVILGGVLVVAGLLVGFADFLRPTRPADPRRPLLRRAGQPARSATRSSPSGASSTREPRVVRRHQAAVGPAHGRRSSSGTSGACTAAASARCSARSRRPPDDAGARSGRGARLRAQRLRRRHPRGDGPGVRVRAGVRRAHGPMSEPASRSRDYSPS